MTPLRAGARALGVAAVVVAVIRDRCAVGSGLVVSRCRRLLAVLVCCGRATCGYGLVVVMTRPVGPRTGCQADAAAVPPAPDATVGRLVPAGELPSPSWLCTSVAGEVVPQQLRRAQPAAGLAGLLRLPDQA